MRRSDGRIKIGVSKKVEQRKKDLEAAAGPLELLLTIPGGFELEEELHRQFDSDRVHGEWFESSDLLLRFISDSGGHGDLTTQCTIGRKKNAV